MNKFNEVLMNKFNEVSEWMRIYAFFLFILSLTSFFVGINYTNGDVFKGDRKMRQVDSSEIRASTKKSRS